jgi:flavorubredoxin
MDLPIRMLEPERVAPDTYVIRQLAGEGVAPVAVHLNSMVITGDEPVIVDTCPSMTREAWMETVFSIVDPADVRWIYISHDDHDHIGNLPQVLELAPQATLVSTWFMVERLAADVALPLDRMRWVNDGESFSVGDRELVAVTPPIYDSPTSRGLFDPKTGVYWAVDALGNPLER